MTEDKELQQFRDLMKPPDTWVDAFGLKAILGGLFVGLIMTPASMYMQLVTGADIGPAAQWVTIILFMEVARRSFTQLSRPEIYLLYYMAGATLVHSGIGQGLIWQQFLVQSEEMRKFGIADKIPSWYAPQSVDVLGSRSFLHREWLAPIGLMALGMVLSRFDNFGLGYIMYRITSDVEKLPFPMAPVGAAGVTALADASGGQETWRWRVFSFGSVLGMAFATIYLALPAVSGAFLPEKIEIFPLPFKDLTDNTERLLPAVPMMLSFDIGLVILGMVLPFWAMIGSFAGLVIGIILNQVLYHSGALHNWSPGMGAIRTLNSNTLDFYFSFGLGLTFAIAAIGFYHVFQSLRAARKMKGNQSGGERQGLAAFLHPPAGRGDIKLWIAVLIYVTVTSITILTAYILLRAAHKDGLGSEVTWVLLGVFVFYGFVYTPIISYVSARMEGIVGNSVNIPFVREATFILTGYQGAAIWFAPFPAHNYGSQTLYFRKTELTGTKIISMFKAEIFILPIAFISTLVFSQFIWSIAPVPSQSFPFTEKMWEAQAYRQGVLMSRTMPGGENSAFAEAFKPWVLYAGFGTAVASFGILRFFGAPILLVYGLIRGLDQAAPHVIIPQFIGALLGRFYFAKKFGDMWKQYIIVFFAGFSCGMGLMMMLALGLVFISKSVFQSPY
ncbi:MAG: peptide transporter [Burkholderiales bacterium]|nr:peptide transporter [Phycisphaerae bacterium]